MTHSKLVSLAAVAAVLSLSALTGLADSGIYVGGGISRTNIQDSTGNPGGVGFDETANGGKLFAGYKLDAIPLLKLAAEIGYREAGQATDSTAAGDIKYRIHGFEYAALAGVGLGPVDLMGRVGRITSRLRTALAGVGTP